jgi:hypothetical protein
VDYTKCLGKNTTRPTNEKTGRQDPSTIQRNEDASMEYATFVDTVGKEKVEKFMPSMKNVFQNTIRSIFPFLKMEMNYSVTCVTK